MRLRLWRLSDAGRYSLVYLVGATLLFLATTSGNGWEFVLMVFGFPLVYAPWLLTQLPVNWDAQPGAVKVTTFVLLWVANAYLWGHTIAFAVKRIRRGGDGMAVENL